VRLIRSKAVGVYFVSQNPLDIPDVVLGQLGNRVQHALRAFTPRDQKAVAAAAETFRVNPDIDVGTAITQLGVGEALVSFLDEKGVPGIVQQAYICPPESRIGAASDEERKRVMRGSPVRNIYEQIEDRESAYEILKKRAEKKVVTEEEEKKVKAKPKQKEDDEDGFDWGGVLSGSRIKKSDSALERLGKQTARAVTSQISRRIVRGILGSILGKG